MPKPFTRYVDFIEILEATSGMYACERVLMVSTLKLGAFSDQLLCKSLPFSAERGFNCDPEITAHIFLLAQEKYILGLYL